ncbi:MAG TPA: hypothetical protein VMU84_03320 [Thermoanaerobaculia bacterium]|nr:hypothetical protein [Thermoanaerobaculia bacterium]
MTRATGVLAVALVAVLASRCTGDSTSTAVKKPAAKQTQQQAAATPVDARKSIESINPAIPVYAGADFRADLTHSDEVTIRDQYGPGANVYTLATDDSFPQVYHYYTTYLGQFRAFPAQDTWPPENKEWRTYEVQLNQAMQDPFIPGSSLDVNGKQVVLQLAETEADQGTVIRYIVTPRGPVPPTVASSQ